jgi:hypothetical protein
VLDDGVGDDLLAEIADFYDKIDARVRCLRRTGTRWVLGSTNTE